MYEPGENDLCNSREHKMCTRVEILDAKTPYSNVMVLHCTGQNNSLTAMLQAEFEFEILGFVMFISNRKTSVSCTFLFSEDPDIISQHLQRGQQPK